MMDKEKVNVEIIANQQAYNTDGMKDETNNYIVVDGKKVHVGGANYIGIKKNGKKELAKDIDDLKNSDDNKYTMIRTDVDSHKNYQTPKLQNQEKSSNSENYFGSSLNITSYNVYDKDGLQIEKIERFV